jgi:four helix bundle protein
MKNQIKNEERDVWKKEFAKRLIRFSVDVLRLAYELAKHHTLRPVADQLVRSGTSVGANDTEAQGAGSRKDFAHFFQIALKSAKETQYWMVVIEHYHGESAKTRALIEEIKEITKIINASLLTMRGSR